MREGAVRTGPGWLRTLGPATTTVLLRHGETALSGGRRFAGRGDIPLTATGLEQAKAAAARLVARGGLDLIVTSPLERAQRTAGAVAAATGVPLVVGDAWVETDFGEWEGLNHAEAERGWPEQMAAWLNDTGAAPPGGESFAATSDRVLKAMRRSYRQQRYLGIIDRVRAAMPDAAITTDIIVGFPGETDADFEATLELLDEVEYDSIFSFKYSRRPNTSALALGDHITEEEKGRRLAIVQERQREIQIRRNAAYVGVVEECLVEGFNKATGQWIGRTTCNRTLNFSHPDTNGTDLSGTYLSVRVTRAGPNSLVGESACVV
jgi:hypothetical protein